MTGSSGKGKKMCLCLLWLNICESLPLALTRTHACMQHTYMLALSPAHLTKRCYLLFALPLCLRASCRQDRVVLGAVQTKGK